MSERDRDKIWTSFFICISHYKSNIFHQTSPASDEPWLQQQAAHGTGRHGATVATLHQRRRSPIRLQALRLEDRGEESEIQQD